MTNMYQNTNKRKMLSMIVLRGMIGLFLFVMILIGWPGTHAPENALGADGDAHVTVVPMTKLTGTPTEITQWDYVADYSYDLYLTITPEEPGTNRTLTMSAPEGFRFVIPTSSPAGITAMSYLETGDNQGKNVLIEIEDSAGSASINTSLTVIAAGSSTTNSQTTVIDTVVNHLQSLGEHPVYTSTALYRDNGTTIEIDAVDLPVKTYQDANIFKWFQMYANGGPSAFIDVKTMKMNGYGVIGYNSSNGFSWGAAQANFALENAVIHEPYWDLSLKVYLPDGITTVHPSLTVENDNDGKGRYVILDNSYASSAGVFYNASKMLSPLADTTAVAYNANRAALYVTDMMLRLESGESPQAGHLYEGSPIEVTYTTAAGTKTEQLAPLKIQCQFKAVDSYSITNPVPLDFSQGFDGNSDTKVIRLSETMNNNNVGNYANFNSNFNNQHIGGNLTFEMGPEYEVYGMNVSWTGSGTDYMPRWAGTFPADVEVTYYIGTDAYSDAVRTDNAFSFPSAAPGRHVDKVVYMFPTGFDLREGAYEFAFDLRAGENLPDNVSGQTGLYRSSIQMTLTDDSCAAFGAVHKARYNVDLRAKRDLLLLQTYGAGPGTSTYPFINETGTQTNDWCAHLAFGYNTFASNGISYVNQSGSWMTYHDVEMVFSGAETLAMMNGIIELRKDLTYTNLYFEYTTNEDSEPRQSGVFNSGNPEGTAAGTANAVDLELDIEGGEYLTSLSLHADAFKNSAAAWVTNAIWSRDGNGGRISFRSRPDRTLPNDRDISVPDYTDPSSGYVFDARMTSSDSGTSAKESTVLVYNNTTFLVRFTRVQQGILYASQGFTQPVEQSGGSRAQGETFTIDVKRASTGNGNVRLLNSELWLRVDPHFVFMELVNPAGLEYDVVEQGGQTYIVIQEDNELNRTQHGSGSRTYTLRMMALPSTPVGAYTVFDAGWMNLTDSLDPEKNGELSPYTYGALPVASQPNVDNPANHTGRDLNQNGIDDSEETLVKMVTANTSITPSVTTGATVMPGINSMYASGGVKAFYAQDAEELTLYASLGGAAYALPEYETILYIPTNGEGDSVEYSNEGETGVVTSEFPMVLRGPVALDTTGLNEVLQYSKTDETGPWLNESEIDDWAEVRCVRIAIPEMPALTNVGVTLELASVNPQNELTNNARAYIAGTYQYEMSPGQIRSGNTNLATYVALQNTIEGLAWMDTNQNGIQEGGEELLSGVKVTLLKLRSGGVPANEADYTTVIDEVETGLEIDLSTTLEKDYEPGRYKFANVPEGTYAVQFASGSTSITVLAVSPRDAGGSDTLDSDSIPAYNNETAKLIRTSITGIVLPRTEDQNAQSYESRYHDSGFYGGISYSFTKIDGTDTTKPLPGARFAFYKSSHVHDSSCGGLDADETCSFIAEQMKGDIFDSAVWDTANPIYTVASAADGQVTLTGLDYGVYMLAEVGAPDGYALSNGCWILDVKPSNVNPVTISASPISPTAATGQPNAFIKKTTNGVDSYFLPNYKKPTLPAMGGTGIILFTMGGIFLIGIALLLTAWNGQKKK